MPSDPQPSPRAAAGPPLLSTLDVGTLLPVADAPFRVAVTRLDDARDGAAYLLVGVTSDLHKKYHSGNIVKELAPLIGGKGGGRPDMAQAGGNNPEKLHEALEKVFEILAAA